MSTADASIRIVVDANTERASQAVTDAQAYVAQLEEERFWTTLIEDDSELAGWWGVVDETARGIVAYGATEETAEIIRETFAARLR
jgi:hypothetical protein